MSLIRSFDKYIHKVFHFDEFLNFLEDTRINPSIDIKKIAEALFYGTAFRMKAIAEIERECKEGVLSKRIGALSDDTIGYGMEHLEVSSLQKAWELMARLMKRNGMIRKNPFGDWTIGVLDGIETFSSYSKCCDNCLIREIKKDREKKIQYYHRFVVLCLIGYEFPIPLGLEHMRKGEGEVECGIRLLQRTREHLGRRFLDAVVADALYCTPEFFRSCTQLGIIPGAVLKENQKELLMEAEWQKKELKPAAENKTKKENLKLWDIQQAYWMTAEQDVRVIWAEREVVTAKIEGGKKISVREEKRNVFVFHKDIEQLSPMICYQIGRHRWDIDASLFMDMTQNWFLKHSTLHFTNAHENLISIRLIAFFLFMFFLHRHINSRRKKKVTSSKDMARVLYRTAVFHLEPD